MIQVPIGLTNPIAADPAIAGGKGASLAKLKQAGFNVPAGFIITPDVDLLSAHVVGLLDMLLETFGSVAVRSSATVEDGSAASFAGQFDTILNIKTTTDAIFAISTVRESLHNKSAVQYRKARGITGEVKMPVILQQMVNSQSAGVTFTMNPITKNEDQVVVNSTYGLGVGVVDGGEVDEWIVDKLSKQVVSRIISEKKTHVVPDKSGTAVVEVPEALQKLPSLMVDELMLVVKLAMNVEYFYGANQDIEWAFENGVLLVLQSRPITA